MASTSGSAPIPFAGKWADFIYHENGDKFVQEPISDKEKEKIWQNQVMIPFSVKQDLYVFGGPYSDSESVRSSVDEIFPCFKTCEPRIFNSTPYNFKYLLGNYKPFRSAPYIGNRQGNTYYIPWLDRVEQSFGQFWKDYGIFHLIQFSRVGPRYQPEMLFAAMHFFEKSSNTFHFKSGMMTPTLFNVAVISGLPPTGETFDPANTGTGIEFDFKQAGFQNFIEENRGDPNEEVSDEEHIAFLTLWLSQFLFCSRSLQVAKKFVPMAIQIHSGRIFSLGRLLLVTLYESIGEVCDCLKDNNQSKGFQIPGPMWFLQLWLNATFERELRLKIPKDFAQEVAERNIEGTRLIRLFSNPMEHDSPQLFMKYMEIFLSIDKFEPRHAPFVKRKIGPEWFCEEFPALDPDLEEFVNEAWSKFLNPTVLSCRISTVMKDYKLVGYQPNLVSRQFGFSQLRPRSMFLNTKHLVLGSSISKTLYEKYMDLDSDYVYSLDPIEFNFSHYCTETFHIWWKNYFDGHSLGDEVLLARLESGFTQPRVDVIQQQLQPPAKQKSSVAEAQISKPTIAKPKVEQREKKVHIDDTWK